MMDVNFGWFERTAQRGMGLRNISRDGVEAFF